MNIALDYVKERVDQVRLEPHIQPADHAKVKCQPPVSHHPQAAGMWVGVKEAVFEKLL